MTPERKDFGVRLGAEKAQLPDEAVTRSQLTAGHGVSIDGNAAFDLVFSSYMDPLMFHQHAQLNRNYAGNTFPASFTDNLALVAPNANYIGHEVFNSQTPARGAAPIQNALPAAQSLEWWLVTGHVNIETTTVNTTMHLIRFAARLRNNLVPEQSVYSIAELSRYQPATEAIPLPTATTLPFSGVFRLAALPSVESLAIELTTTIREYSTPGSVPYSISVVARAYIAGITLYKDLSSRHNYRTT